MLPRIKIIKPETAMFYLTAGALAAFIGLAYYPNPSPHHAATAVDAAEPLLRYGASRYSGGRALAPVPLIAASAEGAGK